MRSQIDIKINAGAQFVQIVCGLLGGQDQTRNYRSKVEKSTAKLLQALRREAKRGETMREVRFLRGLKTTSVRRLPKTQPNKSLR